MFLTPAITAAVPFGLQSAALRTAADIAAAYEANPVPLAEAMGIRPAVQVVPYDAPYGPWWVIQVVTDGAVMFIADDKPAVLAA